MVAFYVGIVCGLWGFVVLMMFVLVNLMMCVLVVSCCT